MTYPNPEDLSDNELKEELDKTLELLNHQENTTGSMDNDEILHRNQLVKEVKERGLEDEVEDFYITEKRLDESQITILRKGGTIKFPDGTTIELTENALDKHGLGDAV